MNTVFDLATRMGDNTLILSHRISQWCGKAPIIEDDIALANVALDLIGQTQLWLGLAGEVDSETSGSEGKTADDLAYHRDAADFHNFLLVERPNGDMGATLMRQLLFDAWHLEMLKELCQSNNEQVRAIAEKSIKEVSYHLERSSDLVIRLGDGTEESNTRMQAALDDLWPYCGEMFNDDATDIEIAESGLAPLPSSLSSAWRNFIDTTMSQAMLSIPDSDFAHLGGKNGKHSEHMGYILAEMQFLQRAYPDASW